MKGYYIRVKDALKKVDFPKIDGGIRLPTSHVNMNENFGEEEFNKIVEWAKSIKNPCVDRTDKFESGFQIHFVCFGYNGYISGLSRKQMNELVKILDQLPF